MNNAAVVSYSGVCPEPAAAGRGNAENRLVSVNYDAVASYTYDAIGRRVAKTVGGALRDYVYQVDGTVGVENVPAGWNVGYVYLNGQMLAEYKDGTTYFAHSDHLGSTRALSTVAGAWMVSYDYLPGVYPERSRRREISTSNSDTSHKFTHSAGSGQAGLEKDAETLRLRSGQANLDHTWFRQYCGSLGRWASPDPLGGSIADPQSLNRYAYVLNAPAAPPSAVY